MKIKKIQTKNYRGKNFDLEPAKINFFFAKNGTGKTSLLDAVRYGITGLVPSDDLKGGAVQIAFDNGVSIQRARGNVSVFGLNGKRSTETAINAAVADMVGLSVDGKKRTDVLRNLKIACSSDVLLCLSPADFSELLMEYVPESIDSERILSYFEGQSEEIISECKKAFPESFGTFGMRKVQEVYQKYLEDRKASGILLREKEVILSGLNPIMPSRPLSAINEDLTSLLASVKEQAYLLKRQAEYDTARQKREMQEKQIALLKKKVKTVPEAPKAGFAEELEAKRQIAERAIIEQTGRLSKIQANIGFFERTLAALDKSACPLSAKLICTTDKTALRAEVNTMLSQNQTLFSQTQQELLAAQKEKEQCMKRKQECDAKRKAYEEYEKICAEISVYEKNLIDLPEKPESVSLDVGTMNRRKLMLEAERTNAEDYEKKTTLSKEADDLRKLYALQTSMIRALEGKGVVRTKIIEYYLQYFESVCNDRAAQFAPGYVFKFHPENGVRVYVKTPTVKDRYYPIESCSNGEKILVSFILTDMLNQLTGTRLMFVDNVEALDHEHMIALAKLLETPEFVNEYDHIFVCGVNHLDVMKTFLKVPDAKFVK